MIDPIIDVWRFSEEEGWVHMARTLLCPFCPEGQNVLAVPVGWKAHEAICWLEESHFQYHAEQMAARQTEPVLCARCQRYALCEPVVPVEDRLHRKCWSAECDCECSYLPTLRPVFKEPSC